MSKCTWKWPKMCLQMEIALLLQPQHLLLSLDAFTNSSPTEADDVPTIACVWWIVRRCSRWPRWFTAHADMGRKGFNGEQRELFNHGWKRSNSLSEVLRMRREAWLGAREGLAFQRQRPCWNAELRRKRMQSLKNKPVQSIGVVFLVFDFSPVPTLQFKNS